MESTCSSLPKSTLYESRRSLLPLSPCLSQMGTFQASGLSESPSSRRQMCLLRALQGTVVFTSQLHINASQRLIMAQTLASRSRVINLSVYWPFPLFNKFPELNRPSRAASSAPAASSVLQGQTLQAIPKEPHTYYPFLILPHTLLSQEALESISPLYCHHHHTIWASSTPTQTSASVSSLAHSLLQLLPPPLPWKRFFLKCEFDIISLLQSHKPPHLLLPPIQTCSLWDKVQFFTWMALRPISVVTSLPQSLGVTLCSQT